MPKTGKTYELGHLYEQGMPQYTARPHYLQAIRRDAGTAWCLRISSPATSARWARSWTHWRITAGIPMLENMVLTELARDKAYEFLLLTLPERIKGASGSMVRPVAIL